MPKCFGFIILDLESKKTILVESPQGHLSFPKGKYEKKDKTQYNCAVRELQEETGITTDLIDIIPDLILSEYKVENICSIQYYIGIIKNKINDFTFDEEEITSVKWYDFNEIENLDNFRQSRKDVFIELSKIINSGSLNANK